MFVTQTLEGDVAQVPLSSGRIEAAIPLGNGPTRIAASPDGRWLVVGNFGVTSPGRTTSVVDTTTGLVATVTTGGQPDSVAVAPNGATAWVTDNAGGTLTGIALEPDDIHITTVLHIGGHPGALEISPDSKTAYVADMGAYANPLGNTVERVDLATGAVTARADVGTEPCATVLSTDGRTLWVSVDGGAHNTKRGEVVPIDTVDFTTGPPITVGVGPAGMALSPSGTTLYVTNAGDPYTLPDIPESKSYSPHERYLNRHDTISVIDLATSTVTHAISVGIDPWNMVISPLGNEAWVVNANSDTVSPIDLQTDRAGPPIRLPGHPHGIVLVDVHLAVP
jgi:YVTN family beta-propeller protein